MNRFREPDIIFKWTNCCRLCLSQESTIDLFSEASISQHFPSKIRTCLNFLIYSGDPMPRKICATCCMKLNNWFEFKKECIQTEKELRKRLEPYKRIAFVKEYFDKYMKYEKSSQDGSISMDSMSEYDEDEMYDEIGGEDEDEVEMDPDILQKDDENSSFSDNEKIASLSDNSNIENKQNFIRNISEFNNSHYINDELSNILKKEREINNENGMSPIQKVQLINMRQDKDQSVNEFKKFSVTKDIKIPGGKSELLIGKKEQETHNISGSSKPSTISNVNLKIPLDYHNKLETSAKSSAFQNEHMSIHTRHLMESGGESDDNDNFINPLSFVYTSLSEPTKEVSEGDPTGSTPNTLYKNEDGSVKKNIVTPWKCLVCSEYFRTMLELKQHYNSVDSNCGKTDINLECGFCKLKFDSKTEFVEHQIVHINDGTDNKKNLVKCNECDEKFEAEVDLNQHKCINDVGETAPERTNYFCSKCELTFDDKEVYDKHELIHNQQDIFNSIVTPQFTTFEGVEDENDQYDEEKRPQNVVRCFRCGRIFNSVEELEQHEFLKHKNPTPYFCRKCDLRFSARSQLLMHVRSHMRKSNSCTGSNPGSDNTCGVCNAKFFLSSDLQSHLKMHKYSPSEESLPLPPPTSSQKSWTIPDTYGDNKIDLFARFKCSVCSKIFVHSGSIIRHGKNLHKGQAVYPLRLKRPIFLMKRARSLSLPAEKNLKIPQTTKPVNSNNVTNTVSQQQLLEENYDPEASQESKWDQDPDNVKSDANLEFGTEKCPFCEKMFKPTYLPRHIKRNHRGEVLDPQMLGRDIPDDSLVCRYCLKSCSNPHNRRVHESIHYPVKMPCTQCKICGEKFFNKSAFEAHTLSCKSVRCGKCNKIFFRHLSLKNHSCIVTIPTENKA